MPKDKIINCKVEEEVRKDFFKACEDNFTTPSAELYKFIRQYTKRNQGQKILLSDLGKKS